MKKGLFAVLLILPLLLGACRSVPFTQASFDRIAGDWDVTTNPGGWEDTRYSFAPASPPLASGVGVLDEPP